MEADNKEAELAAIRKKLKELLIANLSLEGVTPEQIGDNDPLFGEGLGLDSLDAVEIIVLMQRNFKVDVKNIEKGSKIFQSVATLADYIYANTPR